MVEAPQVDARLGLVEQGQLGAAGKGHGDLDALDLAARKAGVHVAVDIVAGAQAHLNQILAQLAPAQLFAGGKAHQVADRQALEAHRLLKGVGDAQLGALGDRQFG